jgi:predicted nucleic acid-binding protein
LKRIVVDASVVLAGLFKDGTVRDILLTFEDAEFVAPQYLRSELERHLSEIVARSRKPEAILRAVLEDLLSAIDLVPVEMYSNSLERAQEIARRADAKGGEDYIAMALAFDAPVWTLDKDFTRATGVRVLHTSEVEQSQGSAP